MATKKFTKEEKKIIINLYKNGKNYREISEDYSCSQQKIRKVINDSGIKKRTISEAVHNARSKFTKDEIEEVLKMYKEQLLSAYKISRKIKKPKSSIEKIIKRYCEPEFYRDATVAHALRLKISDEEAKKLKRIYEEDINVTLEDLKINLSSEITHTTIANAIRRVGGELRDSHDAAAHKNRIFTDIEIEEFVRLQRDENKTISEIAEKFNADYGTVSRSIDIYSEEEKLLSITYWNKEKIFEYAKNLIIADALPTDEVIRTKHRGWSAAIPRHYPGGMYQLQIDLGMKPKIHKYSILNSSEIKKLCKLYAHGLTLRDLGIQFNIRRETAAEILSDNDIKIRSPGGGGDCVESALECTGKFNIKRSTVFYIVEIVNYPTQLKPGIAFDFNERASRSYKLYGDLLFLKEFPSRQDAFFVEEAILNETIFASNPPQELIEKEWGGWTELREMKIDELIKISEYYFSQWEDLGTWKFASYYVDMTNLQKLECEKRSQIL